MRALVARLGLPESRLAVLLLGRGGRGRVRGEWLGAQHQTRTASWWRKSFDGGLGSSEFGLENKVREGEEGKKPREEREAQRKTDEIVQTDNKGWGLGNQELETGIRSANTHPPKQDAEKLGWSQSSEDAYWDLTSRSVALGEELPTREQYMRDEQEAAQRPQERSEELGWSRSPGHAYWEAASSSVFDEEPVRSEQSRNPGWDIPKDDMRDMKVFSNNNEAHTHASPGASSATFGRPLNSIGRARQSQDLRFFDRGRNGQRPWKPALRRRRGLGKHWDDIDPSSDDWHKPRTMSLDIDYKIQLPRALEEKDQDKVARCLYAAQDKSDVEFIQNISNTTFTEILRILGPWEKYTRRILEAYADFTTRMRKDINLMDPDRLTFEYGQLLQEIAIIRRRSGCQLTETQYLKLLMSAKFLGDWRLANQLWSNLHEDGITPNVRLYNAYLAAYMRVGWNHNKRVVTQRVIEYNMPPPWERKKNVPRASYSTGTPDGVKEKAMAVLDAMMKSGVAANEETYRLIINAAAREGEMDTVRSVIRTVWNVDVGQLMSPDQGVNGPPRAKELPRDSPHYPTPKLLSTIADAYGMNSDIPAAMRLVDFVSREYDIAIPKDAWATLFAWTFVLAKHRSGNAKKGGRKINNLPRASLKTLWNTMTADPYLVKPTLSMYNMMIKNLVQQAAPIKIIDLIRSATTLGKRSTFRKRQAWDRFQECLMKHELDLPTEPLSIARRRWESAAVIQARDRRWMKSWFHYLSKALVGWHANRWESGKPMNHELTLCTIPQLLWDWREVVESYIQYDTPTGVLEINMRSNKEILSRATNIEKHFMDWERAMKMANLLVGNELMGLPVDKETGQPVYASRRLRKAREVRMREMMERDAAAATSEGENESMEGDTSAPAVQTEG